MSVRLARPSAVLAPIAGAMLVVRYWPQPRRLQRELTHPHAWIAAVGADNAAATLAGALLWLAALWLCLGTSAAVLSLIPGRFGQVADLLARHALPSALRRVVIAAAGASILMTPISAFAAAGNTASGHTALGNTASGHAALGNTASGHAALGNTATANTPGPAWPTDGTAISISAPSWPTDGASPDSGLPDSGFPAVTVRSGDSLWAIAGRQLGASATPARIATLWPRWYAANRAGVGADPNLLRPGMRLHAPPPAPSNTED